MLNNSNMINMSSKPITKSNISLEIARFGIRLIFFLVLWIDDSSQANRCISRSRYNQETVVSFILFLPFFFRPERQRRQLGFGADPNVERTNWKHLPRSRFLLKFGNPWNSPCRISELCSFPTEARKTQPTKRKSNHILTPIKSWNGYKLVILIKISRMPTCVLSAKRRKITRCDRPKITPHTKLVLRMVYIRMVDIMDSFVPIWPKCFIY